MTANYKKRIFIQITDDEATLLLDQIECAIGYMQNADIEYDKLEEMKFLIKDNL